jgi:sugar lactone lactonase YvrE
MNQESILLSVSIGTPIVEYDPTQAGSNGYDELGFLKIYQEGLSTVLQYKTDGSFDKVLIPAGLNDENLIVGGGMALGPDQLLYIGDIGNNSIKKFDLNGNFQGYFLEPGNAVDVPEEIVFGRDNDGGYSLYVTSLTGEGVKRYDWETGEELFHIDQALTPSNPGAITNSDGTVDLSAAVVEFSPNGKLYIGAVFSDNSILEYDPDTDEVREFISQFDGAQPIPSGITFDQDGNLYNGTFSGKDIPFPGLPPSTVAKYDPEGNLLNSAYVSNANGELGISSRVHLFDIDGDGQESLFVSDFINNAVLEYQGTEDNNPGSFIGTFISDQVSGGGQLSFPGSLLFIEEEVISPSPMYRFRNTSYTTGAYLYVGEEERDSILANPNLSNTFVLEGGGNPAFQLSFEAVEGLLPFYRLRSIERLGNYLFAGQEEYDSIFAENSVQKDKWVKEGLDSNGNDVPDFYVYGADSNQGQLFNRFRNQEDGGYLFAGTQESENILNNPSLANIFINEGPAFKALV